MGSESMSRDDEKTPYALLLQGINVGGHSRLSMTVLRDILRGLGFFEVRTYKQSGNAVVTTSLTAAQVAARAGKALGEMLSRNVGVVVRTAAQLVDVVERWPFDEAVDPTTKHVMFLRQASDAENLGRMPQETMGREHYWVSGTQIYLYLPGGMGCSKLGSWVTRRLAGTGSTARNWNTVVALRDMASGRC